MDHDKIKATLRQLRERYWAKGDRLIGDSIDAIVSLLAECDNQTTRILDLEEAQHDWQPIETAPRDGTWILVGARNLHPSDACWVVDDLNEGWHDIGGFFATQPTHWQHLPQFECGDHHL